MTKPALTPDFGDSVRLKDLKQGDIIVAPPGWFGVTYERKDEMEVLDRSQELINLNAQVAQDKAVEFLAAQVEFRHRNVEHLGGKELLVLESPRHVSTPDTNMFSNCGNFYSWHARLSKLDAKGAFSATAKPIILSQGDNIYRHAITAEPVRALGDDGSYKKLMPTFI